MTNVLTRAVLLSLFVAGAVVYEGQDNNTGAANALTTGPSSRVTLEVINRHFTVGRKIRSVYLRVFSDGTAECHTEKYWNEPDSVKRKVLAPEDFQRIKALLQQPELLSGQPRYELMAPVIDSWMEWTIKVPHGQNVQTIEVANFNPTAAKERKTPYPDGLVKLGCSIWKMRSDVYADEVAAGQARRADCDAVLGVTNSTRRH
jgi:hypothetical protein